jgi:hypothetical protein
MGTPEPAIEWAVFVVSLPRTWFRIDAIGIVARETVLWQNWCAIIPVTPVGSATKLTHGVC